MIKGEEDLEGVIVSKMKCGAEALKRAYNLYKVGLDRAGDAVKETRASRNCLSHYAKKYCVRGESYRNLVVSGHQHLLGRHCNKANIWNLNAECGIPCKQSTHASACYEYWGMQKIACHF